MSIKCSVFVTTLAVLTGTSVPASASSLVPIGVLDPTSSTTAYSVPYAVSQDGTYVVGESRNVDGIAYPVIWSASDGLVALPCPSGANTKAIGVVKGVGSNEGYIIVIGLHEGYLTQRYYKAPLNNLAGGSWADCASAGGFPTSDMRGGSYNDLRNAVPDATGWPPLGAWFTAGKLNSSGRDGRLRGDPFVAWDGASPRNVTSVSCYSISTGRGSESVSTAYYEGPAQAYTQVPNSSGARADGMGISLSFGKSQTNNFEVQWLCGQVNAYSGGTQMEGFRWMRGDADMTYLGTLPGHTSSCAYTIADNGVTAGRSYIAGGETAVVWDTTRMWNTGGAAQSLKDLLAADGVDTNQWSSLVRVYACSDDGSVLAGYGIWAADGSTRGFVATRTVLRITGITVSGSTVTITFTSNSTSDTASSFTLQSCDLVDGTYSDVTSTMTGSAGSFQAQLSTSGAEQFYQIKHL